MGGRGLYCAWVQWSVYNVRGDDEKWLLNPALFLCRRISGQSVIRLFLQNAYVLGIHTSDK